jgi:hypothetical protein
MLEEEEIKTSDRALLGAQGKVTLPAGAELTNCRRGLWAGYELTCCTPDIDGVFDEIEKNRNKCIGFFRYEPAFTPAQHLDIQEQRRREKLNWKIARLGFFGGVLGALIGSFLRDLPRWIVSAVQWCIKTL